MFFILHITVMAISALGILTGISVAMFFRKKKYWLKIHKSVNLLSLGGFSLGIIMAFIYVADSSKNHLDGIHQMTGLIAFMIALCAFMMGHYQFKAKNKLSARTAHRWLGRISLLAFLIVIVFGLMLINIF